MVTTARVTKRQAQLAGDGAGIEEIAKITGMLIEGNGQMDILEAMKAAQELERPPAPVPLKMPTAYSRRGRGLTPLQELAQFQVAALKEGEEFLRTHPWFMPTLKRLEEECPHVPREELVTVCRLRDQDLIVAAAHRKEYNKTHRAAPLFPR
jgi:hypothetical protein